MPLRDAQMVQRARDDEPDLNWRDIETCVFIHNGATDLVCLSDLTGVIQLVSNRANIKCQVHCSQY